MGEKAQLVGRLQEMEDHRNDLADEVESLRLRNEQLATDLAKVRQAEEAQRQKAQQWERRCKALERECNAATQQLAGAQGYIDALLDMEDRAGPSPVIEHKRRRPKFYQGRPTYEGQFSVDTAGPNGSRDFHDETF